MQAPLLQSPFRYSLRENLFALSETDRLRIKKRIMARCKISESSYSRYINLEKTDKSDLPATVLIEFAHALNMDVESLVNP